MAEKRWPNIEFDDLSRGIRALLGGEQIIDPYAGTVGPRDPDNRLIPLEPQERRVAEPSSPFLVRPPIQRDPKPDRFELGGPKYHPGDPALTVTPYKTPWETLTTLGGETQRPDLQPKPELADPHTNVRPTEAYTPYGPDQPALARQPQPGDASLQRPPPAPPPAPIEVPDFLADIGEAAAPITLDQANAMMAENFPTPDYSNPAQEKADANAARDMDRTKLLAQLALASGIVSGAGKSWEGLGTGFANAAGVYDKGFEKYQNALQASADRYQRQQETTMGYDFARRKGALDIYSTMSTAARTERSELLKEARGRAWDAYKLNIEAQRADVKAGRDVIDTYFKAIIDAFKLSSSDSADPTLEAQKMDTLRGIMAAYRESVRVGEIIPPENLNIKVPQPVNG